MPSYSLGNKNNNNNKGCHYLPLPRPSPRWFRPGGSFPVIPSPRTGYMTSTLHVCVVQSLVSPKNARFSSRHTYHLSIKQSFLLSISFHPAAGSYVYILTCHAHSTHVSAAINWLSSKWGRNPANKAETHMKEGSDRRLKAHSWGVCLCVVLLGEGIRLFACVIARGTRLPPLFRREQI